VTTTITRDWGKTIANAAGGAAIAIATYWLLWRGEGAERPVVLDTILTVAIFGVVGFFVHRAVLRSGTAPCPGCGQRITDLSTGGNRAIVCKFCGKYVEGSAGRLLLTDERQVASDHIFETAVPRDVKWPETCCLCSAPATRALRVEVSRKEDAQSIEGLAVSVATVGVMKLVNVHTESIQVPHCDRHEHGAILKLAGDSVTGLAIAFRSHAYLVAFCDKNGTLPRT
jgi:hypothetical protein